MRIDEAKQLIIDIIKQDTTLNPCLIGGSGLGKTTIMSEVAKECGLHFASLPIRSDDALGINIPAKGTNKLYFVPHEKVQSAIEKPTLLYLDEINRADRYVRTSLMELLSEKSAGGQSLHPKTVVVLTLNDESEKYETIEQDQAFKTRVLPVPINFHVEPSKKFARDNDFSAMHRFLEQFPDACNEDITWNLEKPDPRMLVRLNRLLKIKTDKGLKAEIIKFCLGSKAKPYLSELDTVEENIAKEIITTNSQEVIGLTRIVLTKDAWLYK